APQAIEVALALENSFREPVDQKFLVELIDPQSRVKASTGRIQSVARGNPTINFNLPFDVAKLKESDRRQLPWYRLHYRLEPTDQTGAPAVDGLVSFSEITPDLFELRVAAAEMLHEGMRYQARVQAVHPITRKPTAGVRLDAVLTLETDDDGNGTKLPASGVTNAKGYTILFFDVPRRFPEFPHELRPAGGSLHVTGQRAALKVEVENQVLVDQFARMIVNTDKPIYQPGQSLHLRAVALSPTRRALAGQDVLFRIDDPENVNVFRDTVKSSNFGVASVDWPIPDNVRLGDYWIRVSLGSGEDSSLQTISVRISRYDLPNFTVAVQPDRKYYSPGQDAEVKVSADYLFGQPVTRGHVKVVREVEREWNYKEQKWDIEEGDKYEGETDANGVFKAKVKLDEYHGELADNEYRPFRDITFSAYFTDPTTNRTEQRRFDLRVTKDPIHVYVIRTGEADRLNPKLPLEFYVSTFYADGSPAKCQLSINARRERNSSTARLLMVRTNRYGLGKITGLRLPKDLISDEIKLVVEARDVHQNHGHAGEEFEFDDDKDEVRLETDKSLYRDGEPIVASITSSIPNQSVIVDVGQDAAVLISQTVRLSGGQASVSIPYRPEFKNRLTLAAYADFPDSRGQLSTRTVLYPRNQELKIEAQTIAQTYRPGDEAAINFRVRGPDGSKASALGLTIVDQAVEERFRTDSEFGRSYGFNRTLNGMLGLDEQMSGVTLRDLQRLDMSKPLPAGMDLVAEVLLTQSQSYRPSFFDGESFETHAQAAFG
ncbi:MAG TPA: MG2 domain-containing protein, partial [Pyrinomonadaceae bacterium]|nr:MG2 domain-containing protein [Pyrinomonadaceae bacterium]